MPSHCFSVLTAYLLTGEARFFILHSSLSTDLTLNVIAELAERGDALHLLGLDLKAEVAFYDDHNVYEVETVDAHVVLQTGIGENLFLINLQLVNEECSYFFFNFLSCHIY